MTLRLLSLGAGVQSTALLLMACDGVVPRFDAAIFADTGWEPKNVYDHLRRLTEHAAESGIPVHQVSAGNIRDDALDPEHRFASMPLFVRNPDGSDGMARRQCTSEYKLKPIKRKTRELLGYPHPTPVPRGVYVETAIGISLDEIGRAKDSDVRYMRNVFPLLDLKMTRTDCERYNRSRGWTTVAKSACIGCPFHGNRQWRDLRDGSPEEWADAVDFDHEIRGGVRASERSGAGATRLHVPAPLQGPARGRAYRQVDPPRMAGHPTGSFRRLRTVGGRRSGRLLSVGLPFRGGGGLMFPWTTCARAAGAASTSPSATPTAKGGPEVPPCPDPETGEPCGICPSDLDLQAADLGITRPDLGGSQ